MLHTFSFALLFAVLTCGRIASAEILRPGGCLKVKPQKDFILNSLKGVWYEYAKYPNLKEFGQKCVKSTFTFRDNGTYAITVSGLNSFNQPVSSNMTSSIKESGVFLITFPSGTTRIDKIVGIDYNSWVAIYSCLYNGKNGLESAWILTRNRYPDADTVRNAKEAMEKNQIATKGLQKTIQDDCPQI